MPALSYEHVEFYKRCLLMNSEKTRLRLRNFITFSCRIGRQTWKIFILFFQTPGKQFIHDHIMKLVA